MVHFSASMGRRSCGARRTGNISAAGPNASGKNRLLREDEMFGAAQRKNQKAASLWTTSRFRKLRSDYLSFFGGLHFSQTLPSFLAATQHLWSHSLPAALAFSQQVSARAMLTLAMNATAQRRATSDLIDFICFPFLPGFTGSIITASAH